MVSAAQAIFDQVKKRVGTEIVKYPEVIYCKPMISKTRMPKNQLGFVLWFTGLPAAGKTTVANRVYQILKQRGLKVERLDGDIVREYLSRDLGFSKEDRDENIRRMGNLSKLLVRNGIGVIASFISPYRHHRDEIRKSLAELGLNPDGKRGPKFIEVYVNCPLEICEARDPKGLYKKARKGEILNFTGISDIYEPPENPEITLETDKESLEDSVAKVLAYLKKTHFVMSEFL